MWWLGLLADLLLTSYYCMALGFLLRKHSPDMAPVHMFELKAWSILGCTQKWWLEYTTH